MRFDPGARPGTSVRRRRDPRRRPSHRAAHAAAWTAALVVALQTGAAAFAPPASAFTGRNSVIAYVGPGTSAKDRTDVWVSDPDGRNARNITARDGRWEASPMWFVEPGRILFVSGAPGRPGDLYDMFQSGKGLNNLTRTADQHEFSPSYSPGGGRITFARAGWQSGKAGPADIWLMTWQGTDPQNLTKNAGSGLSNTDPVWSPDSTLLGYERWVDRASEIRLMSASGLQENGSVNLAVTPGQDPAFNSHRVNGSFQLAYAFGGDLWRVTVPDPLPVETGRLGVRPVQMTHHPKSAPDSHPMWSPDGTRIVFQRGDHTMIMPAVPGATARQLTSRVSTEPDWQPGCTREGGNGSGVLVGTEGDDLLCDYDGNDRIYGHGGNDVIFPGAGADVVFAGAGDDYVLGGVGAYADFIHGGPGNDLLDGLQGDDTLLGEDGNDRLQAGDGNDHLVGGAGDDSMVGGSGADQILGNTGNDRLNNLDGNPTDLSDGGEGQDTCFADSGDVRSGCELPHRGSPLP